MRPQKILGERKRNIENGEGGSAEIRSGESDIPFPLLGLNEEVRLYR
jgi:hypothetical protein